MNYVIGDVHGCFDEMLALLNQIEERDPDARFVFVGDFVDRGPKVWETVTWAMQNITADGKYRSVQGNHEQMVLQWYMKYIRWEQSPLKMFSNPPKPSYDFMDVAKEQGILDKKSLEPVMLFFAGLPFRITLTVEGAGGRPVVYDIVHAWYDYSEPEDTADQHMVNLWSREIGGNFQNDHIIIHGHTPTASSLYRDQTDVRPGLIGYRHNEINVDGGCVFRRIMPDLPCMLCGICLETLEEFFCEPIAERMDPGQLLNYELVYPDVPSGHRVDMLERLE